MSQDNSITYQKLENPNLIYAVLRNKKRFEGLLSSIPGSLSANILALALRSFTLESGQEEIERRNRRRKEGAPDPLDLAESRRGSVDSLRSPSTSQPARASALSDVPEETFAIGDDEDEDEEDDNDHRRPSYPPAPTPGSVQSRTSSVSSHIDETVPMQLRGMSEKARGKMPGEQPQ